MFWFSEEKRGWLEIITGPMFSGKTEELMRRIKRERIANKSVVVFSPDKDTRDGVGKIISHSGQELSSDILIKVGTTISSIREEINSLNPATVGFDEGQFYPEGFYALCCDLADEGRRVIVSALSQDYLGVPFGEVPQLMCGAEVVTKLHAICQICGGPASFTYRKGEGTEKILVGGKDLYQARCRKHFKEQ